MIQVSAAIIHNDDGEILICQRKDGGNCAFLWEYPGGKQELGETPEGCLVRECKEELEIEIQIDAIFAKTTYTYPDREIAFSFYDAHIIEGTPKMNVHNDMNWIRPGDLHKYPFCPADACINKRIEKC